MQVMYVYFHSDKCSNCMKRNSNNYAKSSRKKRISINWEPISSISAKTNTNFAYASSKYSPTDSVASEAAIIAIGASEAALILEYYTIEKLQAPQLRFLAGRFIDRQHRADHLQVVEQIGRFSHHQFHWDHQSQSPRRTDEVRQGGNQEGSGNYVTGNVRRDCTQQNGREVVRVYCLC